jgi:hypothetical protein
MKFTGDWKHIAIGAVAVLMPVELHYLLGLDWATLIPAYSSTIVGALQIINEVVTNTVPKS